MASRRFLAPQARAGNGLGYLSQPDRQYPAVADESDTATRIGEARAMCDEPEAPSQDWVNAESDLAAERNRVRLLRQAEMAQQARENVTMEHRMADARRRAKLKHIDISHEMHLLTKMLDRNPSTAVARLVRLEARLDGVADLGQAA